MSANTITLTQAQLSEAIAQGVAAALAQYQNAEGHTNGTAPAPEAEASPEWVNINGYVCKSEGTMAYSNYMLARHWGKQCGCDPDQEFRCKAHKNYEGQDYTTWGSDPAIDVAAYAKALEEANARRKAARKAKAK